MILRAEDAQSDCMHIFTFPLGYADCNCTEIKTNHEAIVFHAKAFARRQIAEEEELLYFDQIIADDGDFLRLPAVLMIPTSGLYACHVSSAAKGSMATPIALYKNGTVVMTTGQQMSRGVTYPVRNAHVIQHLENDDVMELVIPARKENDDTEFINKFSLGHNVLSLSRQITLIYDYIWMNGQYLALIRFIEHNLITDVVLRCANEV